MAEAGMIGPRADDEPLSDVAADVVELYRACLVSLERSVDLHEAARDMETDPARDELLAQREELLEEIRRSEAHLGATLDRLQAAQLSREDPGDDLARMREELDAGLAVARRVQRRMDELDRALRGSGPALPDSQEPGRLAE
jgi:predicted nuclease with TOPRIM domain